MNNESEKQMTSSETTNKIFDRIDDIAKDQSTIQTDVAVIKTKLEAKADKLFVITELQKHTDSLQPVLDRIKQANQTDWAKVAKNVGFYSAPLITALATYLVAT